MGSEPPRHGGDTARKVGGGIRQARRSWRGDSSGQSTCTPPRGATTGNRAAPSSDHGDKATPRQLSGTRRAARRAGPTQRGSGASAALGSAGRCATECQPLGQFSVSPAPFRDAWALWPRSSPRRRVPRDRVSSGLREPAPRLTPSDTGLPQRVQNRNFT